MSSFLDAALLWANARLERLDVAAPELLSWFATLALHSTLLLSAALLAERVLTSARKRELLWRTCFALPLITCSLAMWTEFAAVTWHVEAAGLNASRLPIVAAADAAAVELGGDLVHEASLFSLSTTGYLALAMLLLSAIGLSRYCLQQLRLAFWLRKRKTLQSSTSPARKESIARLARNFDVRRAPRVSTHASLTSPVAFGVWRPEVCLPTAALDELEGPQIQAALAHEVAHIACRDPLAFSTMSFVSKLFWWQPLFAVAMRKRETLAEFRCDAMAAAVAGREAVASCLVELASRVRTQRSLAHVPSMAGRPSAMRLRVERVLDSREPARFGRARAALLPLCLCIGAGASFAMPRVDLGAQELDAANTMHVSDEAKALLSVLVDFDLEYSAVARDFAELQRTLMSRRVNTKTLKSLQQIGQQLNALDARRIDLRSRVLDALQEEATRFEERTR